MKNSIGRKFLDSLLTATLLSLPKRVAIGARLSALEEEAFKALVFKEGITRAV